MERLLFLDGGYLESSLACISFTSVRLRGGFLCDTQWGELLPGWWLESACRDYESLSSRIHGDLRQVMTRSCLRSEPGVLACHSPYATYTAGQS